MNSGINTNNDGQVRNLGDFFENAGKGSGTQKKADVKSDVLGKTALVKEPSTKETPIVKVSKEAKLEEKKTASGSDKTLENFNKNAEMILKLVSSGKNRTLETPRFGLPDRDLPSIPKSGAPTRPLPSTPKQQGISETLAKITEHKTALPSLQDTKKHMSLEKEKITEEYKKNTEERVNSSADKRVLDLFHEEFNKLNTFMSKEINNVDAKLEDYSEEKLSNLELDLQKTIHSDYLPEKTSGKEESKKVYSTQDFDKELKKVQLDSKKEMVGNLRDIQDACIEEATGTSGRYLQMKDKAITQIGFELGRVRSEISKLDTAKEIKRDRSEKTIQKEIDEAFDEIKSKELSIEDFQPELKFTKDLISEIKETIADCTSELKYEKDGLARAGLREDISDAKDELEQLKEIESDIGDYESEIAALKEKIMALQAEKKEL